MSFADADIPDIEITWSGKKKNLAGAFDLTNESEVTSTQPSFPISTGNFDRLLMQFLFIFIIITKMLLKTFKEQLLITFHLRISACTCHQLQILCAAVGNAPDHATVTPMAVHLLR